ncbi:MAG: FAD-binding oxidoreductase [Candidatus Andersenbacteria bacterium]|nr:FAD-binding oxidoreductase [Candidatus Andersenbacteria bacterium]
MKTYESWGRYPKTTQKVHTMSWQTESLPSTKPLLAYGLGKSYGDACLNDGGTLLDTSRLNHLIAFDKQNGIFTCESGVTLAEILKFIIPHSWFLPVTPGLKYITVGGAISNDVHGKNHYQAGTFGHYLKRFELVRSDGSRLICSPSENTELFHATIGGIGLTGLITWAEFSLKKISSVYLETEQIVTKSLTEVLDLFNSSKDTYEYTIASIDSSAKGKNIGCGYFLRGNHEQKSPADLADTFHEPKITIPAPLPLSLLNKASIAAFNKFYYHRQFNKYKTIRTHYDTFFYPQDVVANWNYFYGPQGFIQYQCQLPPTAAKDALQEIFETTQKAGIASPLTTLKMLGPKSSLGHLSFPRQGYTLALDFPNTGQSLLKILDHLDTIVEKAGGRIYLAKDARMSPDMFKTSYPDWQNMIPYIDPAFSSSLWRRVTGKR